MSQWRPCRPGIGEDVDLLGVGGLHLEELDDVVADGDDHDAQNVAQTLVPANLWMLSMIFYTPNWELQIVTKADEIRDRDRGKWEDENHQEIEWYGDRGAEFEIISR